MIESGKCLWETFITIKNNPTARLERVSWSPLIFPSEMTLWTLMRNVLLFSPTLAFYVASFSVDLSLFKNIICGIVYLEKCSSQQIFGIMLGWTWVWTISESALTFIVIVFYVYFRLYISVYLFLHQFHPFCFLYLWNLLKWNSWSHPFLIFVLLLIYFYLYSTFWHFEEFG